ncbi:MAG: class I SAM-dependent methyltransferase [Dehalococcoidia bacterium]
MSTTLADETERLRRIWDKEAPRYDRSMRFVERVLFGDGRAWVCRQAAGDVLEVAIGTGRNLPFYPVGVRLTGVDLSPAMLAIARRRAARLGLPVDLCEGDVEALAFPDAAFDTVVCTLSLCNIPGVHRAVAEMKRVLRPGGRLLLLDHVRSSVAVVRAVQRLLEPLARRFEGDYLLRRPVEQVRAAGFRIERDERSKWGIVERVAARKPG